MINWRQWIYMTLTASPAATRAIVPVSSVYAGGSLTGRPHRSPFIVIRMMPNSVAVKQGFAHRQIAEVWAHDEPGSYQRIDRILSAVRADLVGPVTIPDAIACEWSGDSQDLPDDGLGTITRSASFTLIGSGT
jgi:hypothetical protein